MLGDGFIILVVIWVVTILLCIVFSRCEGSASYVGIVCILAAIIITLILWFYPRGTHREESYIIYDNTYIRRTVLVSVLAVVLLFGLIVVAMFHLFDQHRAAPVKPWTY